MTKQNFVKAIADRVNMTQKDVASIIDVMPEIIKETVASGDKIALTGFITFDKADVPEKTGVSKIGGVEKPWKTEAHSEVKAKLSKSYKLI